MRIQFLVKCYPSIDLPSNSHLYIYYLGGINLFHRLATVTIKLNPVLGICSPALKLNGLASPSVFLFCDIASDALAPEPP